MRERERATISAKLKEGAHPADTAWTYRCSGRDLELVLEQTDCSGRDLEQEYKEGLLIHNIYFYELVKDHYS